MNNKLAVLGVNGNAICFDFAKKIVYFFRKGWASKTLKLVDIAIPFDKITAIEFIKPTTWESGRIALIVEGNRLLAEDKFDNNASELSIGDSMYPALQDAVSRLMQECLNIQLVTDRKLDIPQTKNQKDYATTLTYAAFMKDSDAPVSTVKTKGISVGAALVYGLLICLVIVTGIVVFTTKDDDTKSDYTPSKKESHTCYVCGDTGNLKYGSHYYCSTHWAMVKTVAEAD